MKHSMKWVGLVVIVPVLFLSTETTYATPIDPSFGTFGELAEATFGGSGIPKHSVAITTIVDGANTITLGLSAHGRFSNPVLTNNGAGTFFAERGANFGGAGESTIEGALWNFSYFIKIDGPGSFADYVVELLYDFDPGVDTDTADHGILDFNSAIVTLGGSLAATSLVEGSENLLFGFLSGPLPFITPPSGPFDPNALGEYSFALIATGGTLSDPVVSAINVEVVPEPATMALVGAGVAAMAARRKRIV